MDLWTSRLGQMSIRFVVALHWPDAPHGLDSPAVACCLEPRSMISTPCSLWLSASWAIDSHSLGTSRIMCGKASPAEQVTAAVAARPQENRGWM